MLDDLSRREIFYLLRRYSSLSLWQRFYEARKPLYDAIEKMVTEHPQDDPDWMQIKLYKDSLDDHVNFQKGLSALAVGDRSVFRNHEEGFLYRASSSKWSSAGYIVRLLNRGDCPDEWRYLGDLAHAGRNVAEGAGWVIEPDSESAAAWWPTWMLLPQNLPRHPFPNPLPPVPDAPEPPVLVKTGEEVPIDGIYEPEGDGTCMNYLLGGTIAPLVVREHGEKKWEVPFDEGESAWVPGTQDIPTTWRLIWADHRYEDGTIPEEEKDYFAPLPEPAPKAPDTTGRALPGEACTRPGYWWTLAKAGSRRWFNHGEVFPDFPNSRIAQTIWNFDPDQE